jgi:hypothetical protein
LPSNFEYGSSWQGSVAWSTLLNTDIIVGDTYQLELEFTVSRDLDYKLQWVLVDPSPPSYWTEICGWKTIGSDTEFIKKDVKTSYTGTVVTTGAGDKSKINLAFDVADAAANGAPKLTFTKFTITKIVEPPEGGDDFEIKSLGSPNATGQWTFGSSADKDGTLNDLFNAAYFVIKSTAPASTNTDGYGGIQFAVQGDGAGANEWAGAFTVKSTGDWTTLAHAIGDVVYFVIDLAQFPHIAELAADTTVTQAQFYINYGAGLLGECEGYVSTGGLSELPDGAAKFTGSDTGGKPLLGGNSYVSKTIGITLP